MQKGGVSQKSSSTTGLRFPPHLSSFAVNNNNNNNNNNNDNKNNNNNN